MSATFTAAAQALNDNADLRAQVMAAGSAEERAALLRDAGVDVPTHSDVNSAMGNMSDVAGGGKTTSIIVASAPAAAAGAAA